jgi:hypothetical protein
MWEAGRWVIFPAKKMCVFFSAHPSRVRHGPVIYSAQTSHKDRWILPAIRRLLYSLSLFFWKDSVDCWPNQSCSSWQGVSKNPPTNLFPYLAITSNIPPFLALFLLEVTHFVLFCTVYTVYIRSAEPFLTPVTLSEVIKSESSNTS